MTSQEAPSAASGPLLLADISGYTSFLQSVALAHKDDAFADGAVPPAYAVLSNLLDGIVGRVAPPFTLSELEGDAFVASVCPGWVRTDMDGADAPRPVEEGADTIVALAAGELPDSTSGLFWRDRSPIPW